MPGRGSCRCVVKLCETLKLWGQVFTFEVADCAAAMARPLRLGFPGAARHIASRGNARQPIYLDDQERLAFLEVLAKAVERYRWPCYAYCLMLNPPPAHRNPGSQSLPGDAAAFSAQVKKAQRAYRRFVAQGGRVGWFWEGRSSEGGLSRCFGSGL